MDRIEAAVQRQERRLRALEAGAEEARGAEATASRLDERRVK